MRLDLDIRPRPDQFEAALLFVLDHLDAGDEIDIHQEVSPPWFRISAADTGTIMAEMRRLGVRVQPHGV
jgi:hypothetical protein